MANKLRRIFRRSEYLRALDNYRRARRRGDAADAQRWIKVADMHLRVAHRFDEGVHRSMARDTELAKARATPEAPPPKEEDRFAVRRQIDEIGRQMITEITEGYRARQRAQESPEVSPAERSASAEETG
jgi:hypothetical protein